MWKVEKPDRKGYTLFFPQEGISPSKYEGHGQQDGTTLSKHEERVRQDTAVSH